MLPKQTSSTYVSVHCQTDQLSSDLQVANAAARLLQLEAQKNQHLVDECDTDEKKEGEESDTGEKKEGEEPMELLEEKEDEKNGDGEEVAVAGQAHVVTETEKRTGVMLEVNDDKGARVEENKEGNKDDDEEDEDNVAAVAAAVVEDDEEDDTTDKHAEEEGDSKEVNEVENQDVLEGHKDEEQEDDCMEGGEPPAKKQRV